MIKSILFFATLSLALLPTSQAEGLKDHLGCYKTLKVDGQTPSSGNAPVGQTLSSIEAGENPYFRTLDRKRLDHVIVNLYLGSTSNWHSYQPFVLFPEMGSTQVDGDVLTHHMSDDLIYYDNYRPTRVDHKIELEIERVESKKIRGYVSFRSSSRDMQVKRSFLLEKTECR